MELIYSTVTVTCCGAIKIYHIWKVHCIVCVCEGVTQSAVYLL